MSDDGVRVTFDLGGFAAGILDAETAGTRAGAPVPLAEGTTVRVVAYRRAQAGTPDLALDTYLAEATFRAGADGSLAPCTVDAADNPLRLKVGEYDFYAITPALPLEADRRTVSVAHGVDFASSRTTASIAPQPAGAPQTVTLTTLERRCSNLYFTVSRKAENVTSAQITNVEMARLAHAPASATLIDPLPTGTNDAAYTMPAGTPGAEPYQYTVADETLPKSQEAFDLKMQVRFNNAAEVTDLEAEIPAMAFDPGLRYTFDVKLEGVAAILQLQITPWNVDAVWQTDLGEPLYITVTVGQWNIDEWTTDLGGRFVPIIRPDSWQANHNLDAQFGA